MATAYPDLAILLSRVRGNLDEAVAARWSDAELIDLINEAERDIANKTGCFEEIVSMTTTADSRFVTHTGYKINHVEYIPSDGKPKGLIHITPKHLGHVSI